MTKASQDKLSRRLEIIKHREDARNRAFYELACKLGLNARLTFNEKPITATSSRAIS